MEEAATAIIAIQNPVFMEDALVPWLAIQRFHAPICMASGDSAVGRCKVGLAG
jgi:hypothetical protein